MGKGTEKSPYTREDVLRRIRVNSRKAEYLDLIGKWFENGIDLSELDLRGARLGVTHLEGANFMRAYLEGTDFTAAKLMGADFRSSQLEGANFRFAHLEGVILMGVELYSDTKLEDVHWGNYILGEERKKEEDKIVWCTLAANTYRRLKIWHTDAGMYDIAGKFFFREMTAKREAMEWWPKPWDRAFSKILSILCGYGEKPERVGISAIVVVFGLAMAYMFGGLNPAYSIYFSAVSFTALGYGSWASTPSQNWVQGVGAFESFIDVFMIALFLITFVRKMTR